MAFRYGRHPPPSRSSWLALTFAKLGYIIRKAGNLRIPIGRLSRRKLFAISLMIQEWTFGPSDPMLELCATIGAVSSIGAQWRASKWPTLACPQSYPRVVSRWPPGTEATKNTLQWWNYLKLNPTIHAVTYFTSRKSLRRIRAIHGCSLGRLYVTKYRTRSSRNPVTLSPVAVSAPSGIAAHRGLIQMPCVRLCQSSSTRLAVDTITRIEPSL